MKRYQAIAFLLSTAMTVSSVAPVFGASSDVFGHWAEFTITKWQNEGRIGGYEDGTFRPDRAITRAEFVRLLNSAVPTAFTSSATINFSDVKESDWFYADVAKAVGGRVASGFEDGTFRPGETVTRMQAAVFICNAKGLTPNEAAANNFTDAASIPSWAKGAVGAAVAAGYLSGYPDGSFGGSKGMTRAEAVSTLDRVLGGGSTNTPQGEISTPSRDDEDSNNDVEDNRTAEAGNMVWTSGGSGSRRSSSSGGGSSSSTVNTNNVIIRSQSDADDYANMNLKGTTKVYVPTSGLEFDGIKFQNLEIHAQNTVKSAYIGKGTEGTAVAPAYAVRETIIKFNGGTTVTGNLNIEDNDISDKVVIVVPTTSSVRKVASVLLARVAAVIRGPVTLPVITAQAPVSIEEGASVSKIEAQDNASVTVDENSNVDTIDATGNVGEIILEGNTGSPTQVNVSGDASVESIEVAKDAEANVDVKGNGEVAQVSVSGNASANVAVNDTASVGNVAVSGNANADVAVKDTASVDKVELSDTATGSVDVAPEAKVDEINSTSTGKTEVSGEGTVSKIEATNPSTVDTTNAGDNVAEPTKPETPTTPTTPTTVAVTGVSLDQTTLSLKAGETATLTATVAPEDATNKAVTWASSDDTIATVKDGVVTAVAEGEATITVTTADGEKTATCAVKVTGNEQTGGLTIEGASNGDTIKVGGEVKLSATLDSATADVKWESSDDTIATVGEDGTVKALKAGEVTITATSNSDSTKTESITITVEEATVPGTVAVTGVTLNKTTLSFDLATETTTETLTATVAPTDATNQNVTWTSSDESVATVANGTVTAKAVGKATITVTTEDGGKTATCTVTVVDSTNELAITSTNGDTIKVGGTTKLSAALGGEVLTGVTWESSDAETATVGSDGTVTALKAGTVTITATASDGETTAEFKITVQEATVAVESVSLDKETLSLDVNGTATLTATVAPTNATNQNVTWTSSNPDVATVSNGEVTAVKAGTATITVTTEDGEKTATCTVTVTDSGQTGGLTIEGASNGDTIKVDDEVKLSAKLDGTATTDVTWESSDAETATVGSDGTVKALKAGTVTIKATSKSDSTKTASITITVAEKATVAVTGVSLDKSTLTLEVEGTATLTPTIAPANATNQNVTWSSSDENVATVDATGTVTAKAEGPATITATTADGNKTAECAVTVVAKGSPIITVTAPTGAGADFTSTATSDLVYSVKTTNVPEGATGAVKWYSDAEGNTPVDAPTDVTATPDTLSVTDASGTGKVTITRSKGIEAGSYYFKVVYTWTDATEGEQTANSGVQTLTITATNNAETAQKALEAKENWDTITKEYTTDVATTVDAVVADVKAAVEGVVDTTKVTVGNVTWTAAPDTEAGLLALKAENKQSFTVTLTDKETPSNTATATVQIPVTVTDAGGGDQDEITVSAAEITTESENLTLTFNGVDELGKGTQGNITVTAGSGGDTYTCDVTDADVKIADKTVTIPLAKFTKTSDTTTTLAATISALPEGTEYTISIPEGAFTNTPTGGDAVNIPAKENIALKITVASASKVTVETGSIAGATAGNATITGLTTGSKYIVQVDGNNWYSVKADGTLASATDEKSAAAASDALTGTEITGLTNGTSYKVLQVATITDAKQVGGTSGKTDTTSISFTVTGTGITSTIATGDIKLTGATAGEISGTGTYSIAISKITVADGENVTLEITKDGYYASADVEVCKAAETVEATVTAAVDGDNVVLAFKNGGNVIPELALAEGNTTITLTSSDNQTVYTSAALTASNATINTTAGTVTIAKTEFTKDGGTDKFSTVTEGTYTVAIDGAGFTSTESGATATTKNVVISNSSDIKLTITADNTAANDEAEKITDFTVPASGSGANYVLSATANGLAQGATITFQSLASGAAGNANNATEITNSGASMDTTKGDLTIPVSLLVDETKVADGNSLYVTFTVTVNGAESDTHTIEIAAEKTTKQTDIAALRTDAKAIKDATLTATITGANTPAEVTGLSGTLSCTIEDIAEGTPDSSSALVTTGNISMLALSTDNNKKLQITATVKEGGTLASSSGSVTFSEVTLISGNDGYTYTIDVPVEVTVTVSP